MIILYIFFFKQSEPFAESSCYTITFSFFSGNHYLVVQNATKKIFSYVIIFIVWSRISINFFTNTFKKNLYSFSLNSVYVYQKLYSAVTKRILKAVKSVNCQWNNCRRFSIEAYDFCNLEIKLWFCHKNARFDQSYPWLDQKSVLEGGDGTYFSWFAIFGENNFC